MTEYEADIEKRGRMLQAQRRAHAAPPVVPRVIYAPRAHRVQQHVAENLEQVAIVLDDPAREPLAEQVVGALVPPVRRLRDARVELAHPARQARLADLGDEVIVVLHQAVRQDAPAVAQGRALELADEEPPAPVAEVDPTAVVAPSMHVVVGTRYHDPPRSAHVKDA